MPIKVPNNLPAIDTLTKENVFVMTDTRAMTQDIRPLSILILNLMPTKIDTETQLTRLLGNTPLQVELELLQTSTHKTHVTSEEHMISFYKTFDMIKGNNYDGMIITGAPVEMMDFEEVDYWDELCEIMEWSRSHVHSTFYICWGAQAGLYYHYGIPKVIMDKKLSGVYEHHLDYKNGMLFRGFDDVFYVPHSRNTTTRREDVEKVPELKIIASSDKAGIFAIKSENDREIYIMGHSEYDWNTLLKEYERDKKAGIEPEVPENYFPDDDDTKQPVVRWRSCANLLYSNWLNYFVYQSTPYDISTIHRDDLAPVKKEKSALTVAKFGGTSLCDAAMFRQAAEILKGDPARRYAVVSAPGKRNENDIKVTDLLLRAYEEGEDSPALKEAEERFDEIAKELGAAVDVGGEFAVIRNKIREGAGRDHIISRGEYLAGRIMADYLGWDFADPKEMIRFDEKGELLREETVKALKAGLEKLDHAVIPGFYGAGPDGGIRTFTRGGSDITGALCAQAVGADLYENWTDTPGLLLSDPRIVEGALPVPIITYKELRELSLMGADVMHEDAIDPVSRVGIPINIRWTGHPEEPGTLIVKNADYYKKILPVSGISGRKGYAVLTIEKEKLNRDLAFRQKVSEIIGRYGLVLHSEVSGIDSLLLVVGQKELDGRQEEVVKALAEAAGTTQVSVISGISIVSVVSRDMATSPGIALTAFEALSSARINVRLIDHGTDRISLNIGVEEKDHGDAIRALYKEFTKRHTGLEYGSFA